MDCVETLMELVEFRLWPLATFRQDAEYGRHLAIADTARFAAGLTRSQMMLWTAPTLRHQSAKGWLR